MGTGSSLYDVLEVTPKSTQSQVKTAYYKLSKQYHPDISPEPDAKARFAKIAEAYEVLGNVKSRSLYDRGVYTPQAQGFPGVSEDIEYKSIIKNRGKFRKRPGVPLTGRMDFYNFDEFYRQHYGSSIGLKKAAKDAKDKSDKAYAFRQKQRTVFLCTYVVFLVSGVLWFFFMIRQDRNTPVRKK